MHGVFHIQMESLILNLRGLRRYHLLQEFNEAMCTLHILSPDHLAPSGNLRA